MLNLTSITTLIGPLLLAAGVLVGIGVADTQEVYIRELTVPPSFTQMGYSAAVVDLRIHDSLLQQERQAQTRPETRRLATEAEQSPLQLVAQYLNLTLVARALQDASGLIEYSIDGTVVKVGDNHIMRLRIRHRAGQQVLVTITRPATEIEEMLQDAATAILRIIDPQVLCALRLREGLAATPRNIEEAETCVNVTLASAALTDKIWLYNLQGVIAFMHSDYAGATAAFREALRLDPDFSPAQLNLAILLAHNGRHEEAIRAYQAVFRRASRGESPQTYAATYAEWGNSLMALGRPAEARQRYAEAVRSDPHYALAYFFWADALPAGREADELRRLGTLAQQASSQIYTENLVGLIRETQVVSPPN